MSVFTPKALANGQVAASATAIFTATAAEGTYVKFLSLFNTSMDQQTVIIYVNHSGTDRIFRQFVLEENESADVLTGSESIILESGDIIKAESTDASVVDYIMTGVEQTADP